MEEVVAAGRQAGRQVARAPASMTRLAVVVASSILVRLLVARWPHSGQGQPPLFGDFEAQRHWMEITVKLPVRDWYWYDIEYWGLDYPPLTAYVSWMCGMVCEWLIPESMALDESRGFEKPALKALVRGLVVALDALVWMPAALMALRALHRHGNSGRKGRSEAAPSWSFYSSSMAFLPSAALALMQPSQILIDHGHHQYNCVCTGLAVGGAVLIDAGWQLTGAFLFCLSINFKHMALFYAPAFFFFLLAKAIDTQRPTAAFRTVASLGAVVVFTFAALWGPFCYAEILSEQSSRSCIEGLGQVLSRIFPFGRGIFEDKVWPKRVCAY
jgi:alpha-1,3-glucosyltransferase